MFKDFLVDAATNHNFTYLLFLLMIRTYISAFTRFVTGHVIIICPEDSERKKIKKHFTKSNIVY